MILRKREDIGNLKNEALDHTLWRNRSARDYGPVVRPTAK